MGVIVLLIVSEDCVICLFVLIFISWKICQNPFSGLGKFSVLFDLCLPLEGNMRFQLQKLFDSFLSLFQPFLSLPWNYEVMIVKYVLYYGRHIKGHK